MSSETTKVYYSAERNGGTTDTYHTDPECSRLLNARKVHSTARRQLADRRELCKYCSGEVDRSGSGDMSYYHSLSCASLTEDSEVGGDSE